VKNVNLYWLPHCSTCQKAKIFLENKGVKINRFHNLKEQLLSAEDVEKLSKMLGGASEMFSKRAIKYRELGLNKRELSEKEMLDLMTTEYTFIKRPVLVINDKAISGFSEKSWAKFLED
jgi:arsenate reductase (glutaredoxin)